ncbi:MAG: TrkH family potassium uptake protein [Phycisphaerae bacterium]
MLDAWSKPRGRSSRLRAEHLLVITFAGLILGGAILLRLPFCSAAEQVSFLDCLFTATSAVCVTGLTTVDTGTRWTMAGHVVILILIQLGGLGIMTFAAAAFQLFRARLSLTSDDALQGSFFHDETGRGEAPFWRIVKLTLAIEVVGAIIIYVSLARGGEVHATWFEALFLSISAYCNAGFATFSSNAVALRENFVALIMIMFLIIAGGIGYSVLFESVDRFRAWWRKRRHTPLLWSLNTRVVILVSAVLCVGGGAVMVLTGMTGDEDTFYERTLHAVFQSVSARTAGFNSVNVEMLPLPTILILIALMFIGGSPGSCAGGIKTTSFAVGVASAFSGTTGSDDLTLFGRRIPQDVIQRTSLVIGLAALWQILGVMILTLTERIGGDVRFEHLVFEQVSAFNTVGLSMNFSPKLSPAGKIWIMLSMFAGRVGPLTIGLAVLKRQQARFQYPVERVMIG